jgi:hypothetical protein
MLHYQLLEPKAGKKERWAGLAIPPVLSLSLQSPLPHLGICSFEYTILPLFISKTNVTYRIIHNFSILIVYV